tara:strand:- start:2775 stop:2972 length:198 start_codon:yes stop_codon:yes gene_type:complete
MRYAVSRGKRRLFRLHQAGQVKFCGSEQQCIDWLAAVANKVRGLQLDDLLTARQRKHKKTNKGLI